jgi:hypothetical protein
MLTDTKDFRPQLDREAAQGGGETLPEKAHGAAIVDIPGGNLLSPDAVAGLERRGLMWNDAGRSHYDAQLDALYRATLEARRNGARDLPALEFPNPRIRSRILARAKYKGLCVVFGAYDGRLFVRLASNPVDIFDEAWGVAIRALIEREREVTIGRIREGLGISEDQWTLGDTRRVGIVLRASGWRRIKKRDGQARTPVYRPYTIAARTGVCGQQSLAP